MLNVSNIHNLFGEDNPPPKRRTRGPYRKKVSAAEIGRVVRAVDQAGLTIYSLTFEGDKIHLQTRPSPDTEATSISSADDWFSRRG